MNGSAPATLIRAKCEHRRLDAAAWQALASGAAAEPFARMVAALGGPGDVLEHPGRHLATAPVQRAVPAARDSHVAAIDVRALGETVVDLGSERRTPGAAIDHAMGLARIRGRGEQVHRGEPLAVVHARDAAAASAAAQRVQAAFTLADAPPVAVAPWQWLDTNPGKH